MKKLLPTKAAKRRMKILRRVTGVVITLLALLLALTLIAPRIINTDAVRSKITAGISEAVNGEFQYRRIGVRLLPLPRVSVEQVNLAIPGVVAGKIQFVAVYPEILPLFSGTVRLSRLVFTSPEFTVHIAEGDQVKETDPEAASSPLIEGEIERILALALFYAPDMRITVKNGNLILARARKPDASFKDIQADIIFPPKGLKLDIFCRSNMFDSMSLAGTLDPVKLAGQGRIALSQLDLSAALPLLDLDGPVKTGNRRIDVDLNFTMDSDRMQFTLENLVLDYPAAELSGELLLASTSPRIKVSLRAEEVQISSAREFTLDLAGDVPTVQTIFSIVKGGHVPQITFQSHGDKAADLGILENMVIEGSLENGKISVPGTDFSPENISGQVIIRRGILVGKDLSARIGNSQGTNGTLRLDLSRSDVPFRLDIEVEADLADVPPILKSYIKDDSLLEEMARITGLQGGAVGKLILDSGKDPFEITVDLVEMTLSADYERIPYPVIINSGQFSFRNERITVQDINGVMGESTFTGLAFNLVIEGRPSFEDLSGDFSLALDQVFPWLSETLSLEEKLHGKLATVSGGLDLTVSDLSGPAGDPGKWPINATGLTVQGAYSFQDGPSGSIDIARGPESLEIRKLSIEDSVSNSTVSIRLREKSLDLSYSGNLFFSTLDDVLGSDMIPGGQISGNLTMELPLDQPMNFSANGDLQGTDIQLPPGLGGPVTIEEFSLIASEKKIAVENVRFSGPWNTLLYSGKIYTSESGIYLEGELAADTMNLAEALNPSDKGNVAETAKTFPEETETEAALGQKKSALWDLPLRGQIRFSANRVELKRFDFEPVAAFISFTDDDIEITIEEANMCGISLPGTLHATPKGLSLDFNISAKGQDLKPTVLCISKEKSIVTGQYDLDLNIAAQSGKGELIQSLQGNLDFRAYDGFILKSNIVTGIFGILNLTDTYSGNITDMEEGGFSYKSLTIKSDIKEGDIVIHEGALDSSVMKIGTTGNIDLKTMQMDLRVLVAPLRLLNRIAKLPILKQIFGGKLVAIPMQITGDISNPDVRAVSAVTAGGRVLEIMTNTLRLPVTITEELVGGADGNSGSENETE